MSRSTNLSRIRNLRKERKWSLTLLAEKAGMTDGHLSHMERGHRNISLDWLIQIAEALDCKAVELLPLEHQLFNKNEERIISALRKAKRGDHSKIVEAIEIFCA